MLAALEGIGAAVESERAGAAWFDASGLLNAARRSLDGVLAVTRARARRPRAARRRRRSRFAAARRRRGARARGGAGGRCRWRRTRDRSPPISRRCRSRCSARAPETAALPEALERFGIRTLGELAALPRAALADRFGAAGPLARDLARGRDTPLVPRRAAERLEEALELPESGSGTQLEHALDLLIDRLVARRERRGRTLRAVVLSAALVEGGTWRLRMTFREAHADPRRMRLALAPRLAELPAPADVLRLRVEGFGPPAGVQRSLLAEPAAIRAARLREAVRQARAVAGPDAALRSSPSTPTRACPSAGSRSRRGTSRVELRRPHARADRGPRRLATPRPVRVRAAEGGRPEEVGGHAVEAVRESWLVEDRWWTDRPLRRRYWEVVTADGRNLVVFRELGGGRWYAQR